MRYAALTLILGVAMAPLSSAQESTARLLGTITDPTGAVIPAASVVARNAATGLQRKTVANESGNYSIPLLPIGQYTVTAESARLQDQYGYGPRVTALQVDQEPRLDIKLELGTSAESIQVQATSSLLVTEVFALDARNGERLWYFAGNERVYASPISYLANGKQYVSLAVGDVLVTFGL